MTTTRTATATGLVLTAAVSLAALTACSDTNGEPPSSAASKASSAAASLASEASGAFASATAEAGRRLAEVKDGVDARDEVRLSAPSAAPDGRTTVGVTARNTAGSAKSFAVQVTYKDQHGKPVDAVVVTLKDVPAGATSTATARSTHTLPARTTTTVTTALRY
ncbi:hypothetical protein AB0F77_32980 [Streptomyces sp. NPDC026672]|uniref:hypothetical protein n=1 Tax=unclassified Streptomyces TaxID=2593676 RepID=UPI0033CE0BF2